ncbi:MAG TPA: hypothetical protein VK028_15120 [Micromonosporaceae bacterium]|nr:hypothetical protein [Micromonosporaceae bacterium]
MTTGKPNPFPDTCRRVIPCLVVREAAKALDFFADVSGATERMRIPGLTHWPIEGIPDRPNAWLSSPVAAALSCCAGRAATGEAGPRGLAGRG